MRKLNNSFVDHTWIFGNFQGQFSFVCYQVALEIFPQGFQRLHRLLDVHEYSMTVVLVIGVFFGTALLGTKLDGLE